MTTQPLRNEQQKAMLAALLLWANQTAAEIFRVPNLRGDIVINFDTAQGTVKPVAHLSGGASPPTTT